MKSLAALFLACSLAALAQNKPANTADVESPGVFTNTQYNWGSKVILNGCDPVTEWDRWQHGRTTDAFSTCTSIPSGATAQSANGLTAYLLNNSSSLGNGVGGAVGLYTNITCNVSGSYCWAINPLVGDAQGTSNTFLIGSEIDIAVKGAPKFLAGIQINGFTTGTVPKSSNAIEVNRLFGSGVLINDGQTSTGRAFVAGQLLQGKTTTTSQSLTFVANNGSGAEFAAVREDSNGAVEIEPSNGEYLFLSGAPAATSSNNHYHQGLLIDSHVWGGTASIDSQWHIYPTGPQSGVPSYDILNLSPVNSQAPNVNQGVSIPNELLIITAGGTGNSIIQSQTSTANVRFELPTGSAGGVIALTNQLPAAGTGTYTAATSDTFTVKGATSSSHCVFSPTDSKAAAATVAGYISAVGTNSVTITHMANSASGGTVNIVCTAN